MSFSVELKRDPLDFQPAAKMDVPDMVNAVWKLESIDASALRTGLVPIAPSLWKTNATTD